MPFWHRIIVVAAVILVTALLARVIDARMARRPLAPEGQTRYRILRRSIMSAIVVVGVLSALLTIPEVRAVAGGILASSAILGLVVGFASRTTLANFVAGVLIAFTQPLRLGDWVEVGGADGVVEEIGLTYTFIRTADGSRLVIPNEKLASDTIRNFTIVSREKVAQVTVQIPLASDLETVVDLLRRETAREHDGEVFVSSLEERATITLRVRAADEAAAARLERELRVRAHARLRAAGIFA